MLQPDGESCHSVSDEICQKVKALPVTVSALARLLTLNHSVPRASSFDATDQPFRNPRQFISNIFSASSAHQGKNAHAGSLCTEGFQTEQQSAEKHGEMEPQWRRDLNEWRPTRPIMPYYSRKQWRRDLWGIKQSQHRTADQFYYIGSSKYICCKIFKAFRLS